MITKFASDDHDGWDQDTGEPTIGHFTQALEAWSWLQHRPTTVQEAALAFNVPPELIRQSVDWAGWMYLDGDVIEHEGE